MRRTPYAIALFLLLLLSAALSADAQNWTHYGADAQSTKFAPLEQINAENFDKLRVVWHWRPLDSEILKNNSNAFTNRYRSTPVVVDGVLYASSPLNIVTALDAASGEVLWNYDPGSWQVEGWYPSMHRGVAYWNESTKKRVVFGTGSAYLYSLDAETGLPDLAFGDSGRVDLTKGLHREVNREHYSFISPPIVVGDVIVVGSSIADMRGGPVPKNMPPGDVRGFDKHTGKQLWVFQTIPQQGKFGNETWGDESWKDFGGANVWSMMSADPELGYVYLPVSTPSNDFYGGERPGDNLFADSIVCLKASTGERVWHYQLIHHGLWDYDPPSAPVLVDIAVDGKKIKAVAQATKQGFVYVFDRETGDPVWPIHEMPVPASQAFNEESSPTQPQPSWPRPFEQQGLRPDDLIDFTPALRSAALDIIKEYEYGPLFAPPSEKGTIFLPGLLGGSDWVGAIAHPPTGMLYVPSHTLPFVVTLNKVDDESASSAYGANVRTGLSGPEGLPLTKPPYGRITAIDLNTGEHKWVQAMGRGPLDHLALKDLGLKEDLGWATRTFAIATSTLLITGLDDPRTFEGLWAGQDHFVDPESYLRAWDLETGEMVGEVAIPGNTVASPVTYMADGRQYIVVPLGDGEERPTELVALALPRKGDKLPPQGNKRTDADHKNFYKAVKALDSGDIKALDKLLKKDPELVKARGYLHEYYQYPTFRGATLLHHVAGNPLRAKLPENALELAQLLLDKGAAADALTLDSLTTIDLVLTSAQLDWAGKRDSLFALLIQNGADPDRNKGKMLWDALTSHELELAKMLADNGASVDLRFAAGLGRVDLMEGFFAADGRLTPAANSLYQSDPDTVLTEQQILDNAINFAAYGGSTEAVAFLIEKGANPSGYAGHWWSWDWGSTPLHKAVDSQDVEMIRFLVEKGADPTVKDLRWKESAPQWATYYDDGEEVLTVLREVEAAYIKEHPLEAETGERLPEDAH
jgi:quinoprotein glucose dehydrogenase